MSEPMSDKRFRQIRDNIVGCDAGAITVELVCSKHDLKTLAVGVCGIRHGPDGGPWGLVESWPLDDRVVTTATVELFEDVKRLKREVAVSLVVLKAAVKAKMEALAEVERLQEQRNDAARETRRTIEAGEKVARQRDELRTEVERLQPMELHAQNTRLRGEIAKLRRLSDDPGDIMNEALQSKPDTCQVVACRCAQAAAGGCSLCEHTGRRCLTHSCAATRCSAREQAGRAPKDCAAAVDRDLMIYGLAVLRRLEDGSVERVDPKGVVLQNLPPQGKRAPYGEALQSRVATVAGPMGGGRGRHVDIDITDDIIKPERRVMLGTTERRAELNRTGPLADAVQRDIEGLVMEDVAESAESFTLTGGDSTSVGVVSEDDDYVPPHVVEALGGEVAHVNRALALMGRPDASFDASGDLSFALPAACAADRHLGCKTAADNCVPCPMHGEEPAIESVIAVADEPDALGHVCSLAALRGLAAKHYGLRLDGNRVIAHIGVGSLIEPKDGGSDDDQA